MPPGGWLLPASAGFRSIIRMTVGLSMMRRRFGRLLWRFVARRCPPPAATLLRLALPISARPRSFGSVRPVARFITPSCGKTGAPPTLARSWNPPLGDTVRAKTGLLLDAYFSATKIAWILDNVGDARRRAEAGELAFGTLDSFLIWRLTGGKHLTDASNAARTLLFDIHAQKWSDELLSAFNVPSNLLPQVLDCADNFGETLPEFFGAAIPICGVAGDQHAALIGQACFTPGMVKSTYGTGCFVMMNAGEKPVASQNRLLGTLGYRLGGVPTYALEGSIFNAGTAVQWLRDGIGVIQSTDEIAGLLADSEAGQGDDSASTSSGNPMNKGVYFVPAFTGLGAPHWDPHARAAIVGMTRDTGKAQLVRAALEAVCYQTADLLAAMQADAGMPIPALRVDGGMVVNDWLLQFLADILGVKVERPAVIETTALGAACLAGLQCGVFDSVDEISEVWRRNRAFSPREKVDREALLAGWNDALRRVKSG